ncbi:DUF2680 domain-containing protein [Anaerobacillus sp. CMMVII]|uniref:YckD family protein n=1 Tax=Anaerobacillus sp. CMMVII TaxID=2755588 RepID=UPI0021B7AE7A|nr:YckD family protein [Anaerobacillus sp. CMMVII]MCT8138233.1 DUF2680 domain-containing protein [Anaerobacillus sp. CMMVII]
MKRLSVSFFIGFLLCMSIVTTTHAHMDCEGINEVELTEAQKQELETLMKKIFSDKQEVINKYVEYGVFNEETGQKMVEKFDKRFEILKENGFIPKWDKYCKEKGKRSHKDH